MLHCPHNPLVATLSLPVRVARRVHETLRFINTLTFVPENSFKTTFKWCQRAARGGSSAALRRVCCAGGGRRTPARSARSRCSRACSAASCSLQIGHGSLRIGGAIQAGAWGGGDSTAGGRGVRRRAGWAGPGARLSWGKPGTPYLLLT